MDTTDTTRGTFVPTRRQFLKLSAATAAATALAAPALAQSPKVIRFSSQQPITSIYSQAMELFAKEVDALSSGAMKIENFPASQLGDAAQMMTALQMGTQDMGLSTPAWFARSFKEADVFTLPYIISSYDRLRAALDGELGVKINEPAERAGFKIHTGWLMGSRNTVNNVRPITAPEDVKGLKMRVIGSPVYLETYTALGAVPVSMDPGEIYLAMQQHVLDGFEFPLPDLLDAKLFEVSKYLSLDEHVTDFFMVGMNKGVWDGLSPEQQAIFTAAMKTATDWQWANQPANIDAAREKLRTLMTVNDITPENKAKFVEVTRPVYDKFADSIGRDLLEVAVRDLGPAI